MQIGDLGKPPVHCYVIPLEEEPSNNYTKHYDYTLTEDNLGPFNSTSQTKQFVTSIAGFTLGFNLTQIIPKRYESQTTCRLYRMK